MKILYVITKSNWGGAQSYVYALAKKAVEQGYDTAVALGGTGEPGASAGLLAARLQEIGVRTIFLHTFARDVSLRREIHAFQELLAILRSEQPDILHLNSSKAGGIGALAGRIARVPNILFTAHGWAHREARSAPIRALIWLASWVTVLLADQVIVVSRRDYMDAPTFPFGRHKIHLIHNGIDLETALPSRAQARAALAHYAPKLDPDAPRIVAIGDLVANKAHAALLDALTGVAEPFSCTIIGEGELRSQLEAQIRAQQLEKRVALVGFVSDAGTLLSGADLFVLPSRKEGLPFALLEAGRAGCASIASDTGGIREIIENGTSGYLVSPGDVERLRTRIVELLRDAPTRSRLGGALQERVASVFSQKKMLDRTFARYTRYS